MKSLVFVGKSSGHVALLLKTLRLRSIKNRRGERCVPNLLGARR